MTSKEWLEAFFRNLILLHLQGFFRWCWENLEKKQARTLVVAVFREIFFPFESMPEHERLPIWRHEKVERFIGGLTSANTTLLEKVTRQWAEETGLDLDLISGRKG